MAEHKITTCDVCGQEIVGGGLYLKATLPVHWSEKMWGERRDICIGCANILNALMDFIGQKVAPSPGGTDG